VISVDVAGQSLVSHQTDASYDKGDLIRGLPILYQKRTCTCHYNEPVISHMSQDEE